MASSYHEEKNQNVFSYMLLLIRVNMQSDRVQDFYLNKLTFCGTEKILVNI